MGCRDIREAISAFVDGETSPEESGAVREPGLLRAVPRPRRLMRAVEAGVRIRGRCRTGSKRSPVSKRKDAPASMRARARSWRWAAVPLAAAAALGLFLLTSGDTIRRLSGPVHGGFLTTEDRDDRPSRHPRGHGRVRRRRDGMDLLAPGNEADAPAPARGARRA
jgi:hypothetical protein